MVAFFATLQGEDAVRRRDFLPTGDASRDLPTPGRWDLTPALRLLSRLRRHLVLHDHPAVDVADAPHPAEGHGHVKLLRQNVDRCGDAGFPAGAEAVNVGTSDQAAARPARERAQHILARADAAVEHDLDLVA